MTIAPDHRQEAREGHPSHLFTYGTLQPGSAPPHVAQPLARLIPVGPATVPGTLYDLGAFPAAVIDSGCAAAIHGVVFRLPDTDAPLAALDRYEGRDFRRVRCVATLSDGRQLVCWAYAYTGPLDGVPRIPSGTWRPFSSGTPPSRPGR